MDICKVCGNKLDRTMRRCPSCGHNVFDNTLPDLMYEATSGGGFDIESDKKKVSIGYAFESGNTVNIDLLSAAFWYEWVAKDNSAANEFVNSIRKKLNIDRLNKVGLTQNFRKIKCGDVITIGSYPYSADGKVAMLEWIVLDIIDNHALVLTKDCIDHVLFNEGDKNTPVNWETSSLRKWLNTEFYNTAFDENAKKLILQSSIVSMIKYPGPGLDYINTSDNVFVLSEREVSGYCFTENLRFAKATEYAKSRGADYDILEGRGWWWLRDSVDMSNAGFGSGISCVWFKGRIAMDSPSNEDASIRPAMWIDLSKLFI